MGGLYVDQELKFYRVQYHSDETGKVSEKYEVRLVDNDEVIGEGDTLKEAIENMWWGGATGDDNL